MIRIILAAVLLSFGLQATAKECQRPVDAVNVPDGETASEKEMIAASQAVRAFVAGGQDYVECMQGMIDDAKAAVSTAVDREAYDEATGKFEKVVALHDEMVADMQTLAESFNVALRAYNARAAEE